MSWMGWALTLLSLQMAFLSIQLGYVTWKIGELSRQLRGGKPWLNRPDIESEECFK